MTFLFCVLFLFMMVLCPLSRRHKFGRRSSYLCLWNVLILEVPVLCFVNRFLINHFCFVMIVFFVFVILILFILLIVCVV